MRKIQIFAFLFLIVAYATSGKGLAKTYSCQDILEQGKLLSRLERASWVSTDIMMQEHKDKAENIKGYFSYPLEDHIFTCFYSKEEPFKIILKFQYNATLDKLSEPVSIDIGKGNPSAVEEGLIILREEAIKCVVEDKKGFFNYFPNSSFNFIPLLGANEHKVYIITASSNNSQEILLGNDYLLRYGLDFKLIEKKKLHNSLLSIPYKSEKEGEHFEFTMHSHIVEELITATDICTLLLYKEFVEWKQHWVIGKKYISILDLENEKLTITTMKEMKKLFKKKK